MQDFFINNQRPRSIEDKFSIEVQSSGITDQKQSGRCWLFTGLNVLRAQLMTREKSGTFFFSQNYSFFWTSSRSLTSSSKGSSRRASSLSTIRR